MTTVTSPVCAYRKASFEKSVGDSRGIMAGIDDHPHEFAPPFPRRGLARTVWSKEAVQLAAGGVKRALLLLRAVMNERAAVVTDHAVENPVRRELLRVGSWWRSRMISPPNNHRLSTCL